MSKSVVPTNSDGQGNTKTPAQSRFWSWTLNNYTEEDIEAIKNVPSSVVPYIRFQTEIGKKGTPHLQGALAYPIRKKGLPKSLGLTRRIHFEKKIKESTPFQLFAYCKKDKTYDGKLRWDTGNIEDTFKEGVATNQSREEEPSEKIYFEEPNEKLRFLIDVVDSYDYFKGDRKLHIVIDHIGGLGKTEFCRWLYMNRERVIVSGGKASDMKNQIVEYHKANKNYPKIVVFDVPRRCGATYLSYGGIEEIKNMFFYSGKYEGGMVNGNKPIVMIFMNEMPDLTGWSADRLNIYEIHNEGIAVQDDFGLDENIKDI